MRGRNWTVLIAVNVVISAVVVGGILVATGRISVGRPTVVESATSVPTKLPPPPTALLVTELDSEPAQSLENNDSTPVPLVHTVQEGDTLSGIAQQYNVGLNELIALNNLANPDLLRLGQEILVPRGDVDLPTPIPIPETPTVDATDDIVEPTTASQAELGTAVPTPTASGPPLIEIAQVLGSSILGEEVVIVRNRGGAASLEGWTLVGGDGDSFRLPALTLYQDASVRIHSKSGTNGPSGLYLGRVEPAWRAGELITLRNADGEVVDTYIVP